MKSLHWLWRSIRWRVLACWKIAEWFIIEDAKIEPWHFRTRSEVIRFVWWVEWHKGQAHPKTYTLDEILDRKREFPQVEVMQPVMGFKHNSKGQLEQTFKMKAVPINFHQLRPVAMCADGKIRPIGEIN